MSKIEKLLINHFISSKLKNLDKTYYLKVNKNEFFIFLFFNEKDSICFQKDSVSEGSNEYMTIMSNLTEEPVRTVCFKRIQKL